MVMIVAVRIPARITARANGRRTRHRIADWVMPWLRRLRGRRGRCGEADVCVAKDGEQRIKDESDDRGAASDAADEGIGIRKPKSARLGMV